jgi:hypothetical protein
MPIREDATASNMSEKYSNANESKGGRGRAGEKSSHLLEDGPPPEATGEADEGLPSYKEATG